MSDRRQAGKELWIPVSLAVAILGAVAVGSERYGNADHRIEALEEFKVAQVMNQRTIGEKVQKIDKEQGIIKKQLENFEKNTSKQLDDVVKALQDFSRRADRREPNTRPR